MCAKSGLLCRMNVGKKLNEITSLCVCMCAKALFCKARHFFQLLFEEKGLGVDGSSVESLNQGALNYIDEIANFD